MFEHAEGVEKLMRRGLDSESILLHASSMSCDQIGASLIRFHYQKGLVSKVGVGSAFA